MSQCERVIVFFDGYCHLCDGTVRFLIQQDPAGIFAFAPLESTYAQHFFAEKGFSIPASVDSIIVYKEGVFYLKSDGAIAIGQSLGGFWRIFTILRFLPKAWRDVLYDFVARNRYRIMGKRASCRLPVAEERDRFLS